MSSHSPTLLASYQADLRDVNSYIRDAEQSVETNPNDAEAQQYLMDAYDQKAMVYEMALNRSLPIIWAIQLARRNRRPVVEEIW